MLVLNRNEPTVRHLSAMAPSRGEAKKRLLVGTPTSTTTDSCRVRVLLWRFLWFVMSFSIAESALVVSVSMAARVFGRTGSWTVSALYFSYAMGTLLTSRIIMVETTQHNSLKLALVIGQFGLLPIHLASYHAAHTQTDDQGGIILPIMDSVLLVASAILSGAAAGIAWAAAGAFVTNTALALSELHMEQIKNDPIVETSTCDPSERTGNGKRHTALWGGIGDMWRSKVDEALFAHKDFHSLAGNLMAFFNVVLVLTISTGHAFSSMLLFPVDDTSHVIQLYLDMLLVASFSAIAMVVLVWDPPLATNTHVDMHTNVENTTGVIQQLMEGSDQNTKSVLYSIFLTLEHPQLSHLIGTHMTSGLMEGFILCFVGGYLVTSPSRIGIFLAFKSMTAAIMAPIFARLGNSYSFGRINVLLVGALCYFLSVAFVLFAEHQTSQELENNEDLFFVVVSAVYIFAGIGFSTWQGTGGGALLSEIATSLARQETRANNNVQGHDPNLLITTSAFSGCKVFSGMATAISLLVFSAPSLHYAWKVGICVVSIFLGVVQLILGHEQHLWDDSLGWRAARRQQCKSNYLATDTIIGDTSPKYGSLSFDTKGNGTEQ
uniref:Uncharacterized protein n=1 Tax=Attheya septentrionalis TaxID=420275 RepID=A0A7S2UPC0_9STRA|mmetsp:Transcript_6974/g.12523  ORF Transcript_6974/g.12523 Transcript_6974/m.12523 type:complete len:605 (+) Transcript_6974:92-1906(+)